MQLGINLDFASYHAAQQLFNNRMRQSNGWKPIKDGSLTVDEDGNLASLDGLANKLILSDVTPPLGQWNCYFDGPAKVRFHGRGVSNSAQDGNHVRFEVVGHPVAMLVTEGLPKNIRIYPPGVTEEGWNPEALEFFSHFNPLRALNLLKINNSKVVNFEDFRSETHITQAPDMAPGLVIDFCNAVNKDLWLCIPHLATDDCVRKLAELTAERLNGRVYLEYSNEASWNGIFAQTRYMIAEAERLGGLGGLNKWRDGMRFYTQRAGEIFEIWKPILGDRVTCILSSQSQNPDSGAEIMDYNDADKSADALAIAPYFGAWLGSVEGVADWTEEQVFEYLRDPDNRQSIPDLAKTIAANKANADEYGLDLIAYEGGQHLTVNPRIPDRERVEELFHRVNQHPEMAKLYAEYLAMCDQAGIEIMCHLSAIFEGEGNWGLIEKMGGGGPKLDAVLAFMGDALVTPIEMAIAMIEDGLAALKEALR